MKIGHIGHSPLLTTGQGIVSRRICDGLHHRGWDLACLGVGQKHKYPPAEADQPPYIIMPSDDDMGFAAMPFFLQNMKPDMLFIHGDLMMLSDWVTQVLKLRFMGQIVLYFSVDAIPIYHEWLSPVRVATRSACYTHCGAEEMSRLTGRRVEGIHLGVDHDSFSPGDPQARKELRQAIGWSDKYVAMYVARNTATKQLANLVRAMGLLRSKGVGDILCYLHTQPVNRRLIVGGWDLPREARQWGAEGAVVFPPGIDSDSLDIPLHSAGPELESGAEENRGLAATGLVDRYRCADLYLHVSSCEGFGLPLVEAMACGLPVAHHDDGYAMSEVCGDAGFPIPPVTSDITTFGGEYFISSPSMIAGKLLEIREQLADPAQLELARRKSLRRAADFEWSTTVDRLHQLATEAATAETWQK